jgi:hypothetical protein
MQICDTPPVRTSRTPRPRLLSRWQLTVLITVLAGFFLMHGLSGADACVPSALDRAVAQYAVVSASTSSAMAPMNATSASAGTEAVPADSCCAVMGTMCVPLRPQDSTLLLTLLLLGLATLPTGSAWTRFIAAAMRGIRGARLRSFGGPPVRVLACVSRT